MHIVLSMQITSACINALNIQEAEETKNNDRHCGFVALTGDRDTST